ncbi:MAG: flagellar biosynthesis protein FlgD [Helicobacter sp.]|nr:flagellar biosynthesis protein FlgD [Helicobacter sp.]
MADISGVNSGYNTPTMNTTNKKDSGSGTNTNSGLNQATNPNKNSGSGTNTDNGLNKPTNGSNTSGSGSGNNTSSGNNNAGSVTSGSGSGTSGSGSGTNNSGSATDETNKSPTDNPSHAVKPKDDNNSLDKDAFLKLFLEQLKAQDPTAPMETNQILEQSAMMTQIEMQQQMKETLASMTESIENMAKSADALAKFQTNMGDVLSNLATSIEGNNEITTLLAQLNAYNTSGVLGKIAETQFTGIALAEEQVGKRQTFDLYFDEPINLDKNNGGNELAKVIIKDKDGATVKTIELAKYRDPETGAAIDLNGKKGYITFEWDAKDQSGNNVKAGGYSITAEYNYESDGKTVKTTKIGRGEVMGVAFQDGIPFIKLGTSNSNNNHFQMLGATQFYAKPA